MSTVEQSPVTHPVAKTGIAVVGAGGSQALEASPQAMPEVIRIFGLTLADWATIIAIGYTLHLWGELWWRTVGRPFAESRGWLPRLKRRSSDADG